MTFEINSLVPELWCSDFEKSLGFYTRKLGFEIAQQRGDDPHAYLSCQGSQIMLAWWEFDGSWEPWYPKPMEKPFGRGINFQFMVEGINDLHERVVESGIKPFMELHTATIWKTDRMDERAQFMVLDPDGYILRFSETVSHRPIEQADIDALDRTHTADG